MTTLSEQTIYQFITLVLVNLLGIVLISIYFYLSLKIPKASNRKIILSILFGVLTQVILIIVLVDVGIVMWIERGNFLATFSVLPFYACIGPLILPISILGAYIQFGYGEKFRDQVDAYVKRKSGTQ